VPTPISRKSHLSNYRTTLPWFVAAAPPLVVCRGGAIFLPEEKAEFKMTGMRTTVHDPMSHDIEAERIKAVTCRCNILNNLGVSFLPMIVSLGARRNYQFMSGPGALHEDYSII
jgi:hypothetical protein